MTRLLCMSAAGGLMIAAIALVRAVMLERLPKRWLRLLWLAAALRMLLPVWIEVELPTAPVLPIHTVHAAERIATVRDVGENPTASDSARPTAVEVKSDSSAGAAGLIAAVWAVGAASALIFFLSAYGRTRRMLKGAQRLNDAALDRLTSELSDSLGVPKRPMLASAEVGSALTIGLFKPVIVLPPDYLGMDEERLGCIIAHELTHIRRNDMLYKWLICLAACVHWFNPLAWLMLRLANRDIELSCDEAVLRRFGDRREQYALCLIEAEEMRVPLANSFGGHAVTERIRCIMNTKKLTIIGAAVLTALIAGMASMFVSADQSLPENGLPADGAQTSEPVGTEAETIIVYHSGDETSAALPSDSDAEPDEAFESTAADATADETPAELSLGYPLIDVDELRITAVFGTKDNGVKSIFHSGVDFAAEKGTDILAAADGIVESAGFDRTKGNYIVIAHEGGVKTCYAHCSELFCAAGDSVSAGQVIASVGSTGNATGPNLHFEVEVDGEPVDPMPRLGLRFEF